MSVPNNPFQNPFYNRFKDPVTRRQDEVDNYSWLRPVQITSYPQITVQPQTSSSSEGKAGAGERKDGN